MQGAKLKGNDSVEDVVQCLDHDSVLFFTSDGVVHSLKAHQIPQASRTAIGTSIAQVFTLSLLQPLLAASCLLFLCQRPACLLFLS